MGEGQVGMGCLQEGMCHLAGQKGLCEPEQAQCDGVDGLGTLMPLAEPLQIQEPACGGIFLSNPLSDTAGAMPS